MGERENRETATARSLSVVHYIERDQDAAARLVAGLLERTVSAEGNPSLVAVLPTPDDALSFCEVVRMHRHGEARALTPMTSVARGRRLLAAGATAIAGAPLDLARLIADSRLALSPLHTLVLVWPEEVLADDEQRGFLESVMGEVPKPTERVAICSARTAELAQFLERSMWKARAVDHATPAPAAAGNSLRVITAVPSERVRALRSVLDAFDPETAILLTFSDENEAAARDAAALLGSDGDLLQVSRGVPEGRFSLGIIFDDVPTADAITAAASITSELVAIVRPSRLPGLQKVASATTPLSWTGALANARSAHDKLRDEVRGTAVSGSHVPWIPIVEPLLEGLDPVEVAAAALALLDRERRKAKRAATATPAPPAPQAERPRREGRPGSFGAPSGGRRDDARGDRSERGSTKRPSGAGGGGFRKRDDTERRGPPRDRSDRPRRDNAGAGREGRGRRDEIERVPRAAREGREWSERSERLRHSRRGPRTGDAE
jgi:hypothetical protein